MIHRRFVSHLCKFFLILIANLFLFTSPIFAQDFEIARHISYFITDSPNVRIEEDVTLTNLVSDKYAQQYQILIDHPQVSDVTATVGDGSPLTVETDVKLTPQQILVQLPPTLGKGNQSKFQVSYTIVEAINHHDRITEFTLPKISRRQGQPPVQITLNLDASLPPLAYLYPQAKTESHQGSWHTYTIELDETSSIKGILGSHQVYDFNITYPLTQSIKTARGYEVALPPDTSYQHVAITSINPPADTVERDSDGNWIAIFSPNILQQTVTITGQIREFAVAVNPHTLPPLPKHTQADTYWETTAEPVITLFPNLTTPEAIYQYLVSNFTYDYQKSGDPQARAGAAQALTDKSGNCMEFTDAFIALARAAGIPARRVVGYAISDSPELQPIAFQGDILHTWPEYWDSESQQWIPIDPTWATTADVDYFHTWDFKHITLAINGQSSTQPFPPLTTDTPTGKNISITPSTNFPESQSQYNFQAQVPLISLPFITQTATILFHNQSPFSQYDTTFLVQKGSGYSLKSQHQLSKFTAIPPSGSGSLIVKYSHATLLPPESFNVVVRGEIYSAPVPTSYRIVQVVFLSSFIFFYVAATIYAIRLALKLHRSTSHPHSHSSLHAHS